MTLTLGVKIFTFHYVSIKTKMAGIYLIRLICFTFHYVSIKTKWALIKGEDGEDFTFHYVSIKTRTTRHYVRA